MMCPDEETSALSNLQDYIIEGWDGAWWGAGGGWGVMCALSMHKRLVFVTNH